MYVNCWENPTCYSVLEHLAMQLPMLGAEKLSISFKLQRLKKHLSNKPLVIVLDEIDQPPPKERNSILYNLTDFPLIGLICACNSQYVFFGLEERVKAWLNDTLIHSNNVSRGIPAEPDTVAVTLNKGTNHLMLKVTDDIWSWGAIVRLTEP